MSNSQLRDMLQDYIDSTIELKYNGEWRTIILKKVEDDRIKGIHNNILKTYLLDKIDEFKSTSRLISETGSDDLESELFHSPMQVFKPKKDIKSILEENLNTGSRFGVQILYGNDPNFKTVKIIKIGDNFVLTTLADNPSEFRQFTLDKIKSIIIGEHRDVPGYRVGHSEYTLEQKKEKKLPNFLSKKESKGTKSGRSGRDNVKRERGVQRRSRLLKGPRGVKSREETVKYVDTEKNGKRSFRRSREIAEPEYTLEEFEKRRRAEQRRLRKEMNEELDFLEFGMRDINIKKDDDIEDLLEEMKLN